MNSNEVPTKARELPGGSLCILASNVHLSMQCVCHGPSSMSSDLSVLVQELFAYLYLLSLT